MPPELAAIAPDPLGSLTSLEGLETNGRESTETLPARPNRTNESSIAFRHSGAQWHREKVVRAFDQLMVHEMRLYSYLGCGSGGYVVQSEKDPSKYSMRSDTCHDRWCPACARARATVLRRNLEPLLKDQTIRMITLTLKNNKDSLKQKLEKLETSFSRLRRMAIWTGSVTAGVAFVEVKIGKQSRCWHPHIHALVIGSFIAQSALRDAWLAVTADSHIVDIRLVSDPTKIAQYITKYCTKPADNELYRDQEALCEAIRALKGRRMCTTFGKWRGIGLLKNDTIGDWIPVMPWRELLKLCRMGDNKAIDIYRQVSKLEWVADPVSIEFELPPPF